MAPASKLLSEEQLRCSICLDVFTDPITTPCGHNYCNACITHYWNTKDECRCPLCSKAFHKRPEFAVNKVLAEMADQFRVHKLKEEYERKTVAEVQQMVQERQVKIQEVQHSVELSKKNADREKAGSVQVFTALISSIERSQAELINVIEEKQKTTEIRAEGFIEELQLEIAQLEKRISELKQPHTEDHLLQNTTSINTPPPTKDWTKINVPRSSCEGTVRKLRKAVAQLEKTLRQEMDNLCNDDELRRMQQYKVDVTLDPDTAHPKLILSKDGKQVSHVSMTHWQILWQIPLPENKERFSQCVCVLGKQSFSSGRFYFEVQVRGKTAWTLGVARESINRKGIITLCPNNGYWSIEMLRNGNKYWAGSEPHAVLLPVREEVQKVGVFVDYEEGLVSFYDVEARVHLYSFTGCTFTEKLYPYFSPCLNAGGKNSAPLIISPEEGRAGHLSYRAFGRLGGWCKKNKK